MSTSPFVPTPFTDPVVNPATASLFRRTPYIGLTQFQQAPTAVATGSLVPGADDAVQAQALANVINRASDWVDTICFDSADGTLAASPSTESTWVRIKADGVIPLQCYYRPILEFTGCGLGISPSGIADIGVPQVQNSWIEGSVIRVPLGALFGPLFGGPFIAGRGRRFAVWTYVSGFPHNALAESCDEGATSITVDPSVPGGTGVYGVCPGGQPGTQLTIHDVNTEVVIIESVSGTTLNLASPTQYAHTVPTPPDTINVSAIPWQVEQACISLTACLIKMRGTRAQTLPSIAGKAPDKQAIMDAGGLDDYEAAVKMLKPWTTVYRRAS